MTTYTLDLELRLAVAKTMPDMWPNARIEDNWVVYDDTESELELFVPVFDISFDAILPLVRELTKYSQQQTTFHYRLYDWWEMEIETDYDFIEWTLFEATPTDLCRAYLAAKGEKDVL